jgi:two-component system response regulator NreC
VPPAAETDEKITIVLADDHELVRAGIRKILEDEAGFEVVAEAGDAEAAARYVLGHKPSVLVLDLSMPGLPSLEALPKVFEASPDTKVVVLTMQNEPAFARTSLQGGAKGYVI